MLWQLVVLATTNVPRREIAPRVYMPLINFGFQKNHTSAFELGVRGVDTALVYGDAQQKEVGRAVRAAMATGVKRSDIFVTSKIPCCPGKAFSGAGGSLMCLLHKDPSKAVQHDFDMLGLDYIDLMLVHWPCDDFEQSVATYKAMEPFFSAGKIKALGVSNFNASALAKLLPRVAVKPVVDQCAFSIAGHTDDLWGRDDATKKFCDAHGIAYSAYSPLGGWAKHGTGHVLNDPTVKAVAAAHNVSAAQVAMRWVTQQDVVAVTSSDKDSHIVGDLASFAFNLTDDELARLAQVQ